MADETDIKKMKGESIEYPLKFAFHKLYFNMLFNTTKTLVL